METETKHTPTPWRLGFKGEGYQTISGNRDVKLGEIQWSEFAKVVIEIDGEPEPIGEANAAFIVRACNAHDELVAALTAAQKTLLKVDAFYTRWRPDAEYTLEEAIAIAAKALSNAHGEA